jgi:hypothetical protein
LSLDHGRQPTSAELLTIAPCRECLVVAVGELLYARVAAHETS